MQCWGFLIIMPETIMKGTVSLNVIFFHLILTSHLYYCELSLKFNLKFIDNKMLSGNDIMLKVSFVQSLLNYISPILETPISAHSYM